MGAAERLTSATQGLRAAAIRYTNAKQGLERSSALHGLCLAAEHYIETRTAFRAWLDTLPPPKSINPPDGG